MQLKKIILCGFKSFADKTEFEFGDGITVVVGPNGCGKSNIVDAVKWVLGEQSAKSLRGGNMLDVIFNGSNSRKSMGYAEVTLVFANTSRLLKTDQDDVAVTRKLYRSGESEYLLNNQPCRLKDIREMFMDTGIGADAYSIIEQGKVEVLLQASKQDRRAIFEEAAGISKYKARKKEALRKLERTDQNMLRLHDIVEEVDKRLRSIKYQAGKARNYQSYSSRLKELRLSQYLSDYYNLKNEAQDLQKQLTGLQDEILTLTTASDQAQAQLSRLGHELDQTVNEIRQVENQLLQCTSQISNQEDRIELGRRRCEELQETLSKSRQQMQTIRQSLQKLHQDLAGDQEEIQQTEQHLAEQQGQLQIKQESYREMALELADRRSQLEDEKSGMIDIVRRTAQLHNEIQSLDIRRNNLSGQKDRLSSRYGQIGLEMEGLLTQRAQLNEKQQQVQQLLADSQARLETTRQQLAGVNQDKLTCGENLASAKEYRSGLVSRQQLLSDLEANLEGVDSGVRQILQEKSQNPESFYYVKGMVAELLRADVKYASIIEAALTDKAQHLVVTSSQAVLEDHSRLEELTGRVQMICLDRIPPYHNGYDFSVHPEVKAKLIDLVEAAPDNERLAWHLLGKTILVDTIDSAVRLAQVAPAGYRWVSLEGEVLEADGTLHMGPMTGQAGLISRKSELRQLQESLTEAEDRIAEMQHQFEQYNHQIHHLEKNLQELRTAIYETNTEEIETRSRIEQVDQNLSRLKREQPLITSEMAGLEEQIEESLRLQASSQQNLNDLQTVNQQRQEQINILEEQIREYEAMAGGIQDEITELKVSLGQIQQKRVALRDKSANIQTQIRQQEHSITTLQNDLKNAQGNFDGSQRAILAAESRISELFMNRQEYQEKNKVFTGQREQFQAEIEKLLEQARELRSQKEARQQLQHELELRTSENHLRMENLSQRAHDEIGLDLEEGFRNYEHEQKDWEAIRAEIEDLKTKIERLGNINLDAITEQEELEQRSTHLNQELADLNTAKKQLEQLIERINKESTELFRQNFETIRENFADLFRKLFGGGRAEIVLEDPENVLECGIEIIARPPGKQLQSITLMSGGEKTMTAVALLMAIFKSKPSPFCLMDEVDAALDEANNERFNLVVQEFLETSQFVVITHSRRTMAIADTIYGVTMQEQGVSKKVSVRFSSDNEQDASSTGNAVA